MGNWIFLKELLYYKQSKKLSLIWKLKSSQPSSTSQPGWRVFYWLTSSAPMWTANSEKTTSFHSCWCLSLSASWNPSLQIWRNDTQRLTNASAESFNAKIKAFRTQFRGVTDIKFFMYRLSKLYSWPGSPPTRFIRWPHFWGSADKLLLQNRPL